MSRQGSSHSFRLRQKFRSKEASRSLKTARWENLLSRRTQKWSWRLTTPSWWELSKILSQNLRLKELCQYFSKAWKISGPWSPLHQWVDALALDWLALPMPSFSNLLTVSVPSSNLWMISKLSHKMPRKRKQKLRWTSLSFKGLMSLTKIP